MTTNDATLAELNERYKDKPIGDIYRDENGYRYFMTQSPADVEDSFTIYQIFDDLLFTSDLKDASTHLYMLHDICQPDESYDINDYGMPSILLIIQLNLAAYEAPSYFKSRFNDVLLA